MELSERLRKDGIDARLDLYTPWPAQGWPRWMEQQLARADFVILLCTATYARRVTGDEEPGAGRGVCWEATLIYNELYHAKLDSNRFLPAVFDEASIEHIPRPLQGHPWFQVGSERGYEDLYRRLLNRPVVSPAPLGERRRELPSRRDRVVPRPLPEASATVPPAPSGAQKFFISYPHGDPDEENLARFLHAQLTAAGHEAFIDIGMAAGIDWVKEIRHRIDWCDQLVLLISEKSMRSEMVQTEVRLARHRQLQSGRPGILPVRVRYLGPLEYELELHIGHLQHVSWEGPDASQHVYEQIERASRAGPTAAAPNAGPKGTEAAKVPDEPARPEAARDTRTASAPGGTIRWDDPFYISRPADGVVQECATRIGQTVVIKGPRQVGKSSLLLRYLHDCQQAGKRLAYVDFQVFTGHDMEDYPRFLSRFAEVLSHRLKLAISQPIAIESQFDMVRFLEETLLPAATGPLVIALDEVDRLLGQPYQTDFFSMLRLWHNNRSPLTPEYEDLDLALVISTEPYLLIDRADRSPFNVGLKVEMKPFNREQCVELNTRHDDLLRSDEVLQLYDLLHGHPYLTRLSYYRMTAIDKISFADLIDGAAAERGPFGDHLRSLLVKLHDRPDLLAAMKQVIFSSDPVELDLYYRLYGAGLVRREGDRVRPANALYARYFRNAL